MEKLTRVEIERLLPRSFPAFIQGADGKWKLAENVTVKEWREQRISADRSAARRRAIGKIMKLADRLGLPPNTVLADHLQTLP